MALIAARIGFSVVFWFLALSGVAHAQSGACQVIDDLVMYNFRGELRVMHPIVQGVPCGTVTRTATSGGGALVSQAMPINLNGSTVNMTTSRSIARQAIIRGASRALTPIGIGLTLAAVANDVKCRNSGTPIAPIFECDAGAPVTTTTSTSTQCVDNGIKQPQSVYLNGCVTEAQEKEWCFAHYQTSGYASYYSSHTVRCHIYPSNPNRMELEYANAYGGWSGLTQYNFGRRSGTTTTNTCPSGLAASTLGGVAFCPTGTYTSVSADTVEGRVGASPNFTGNEPNILGELPPGAISNADPGVGPSIISGPTSSTGSTGHRSGTGTGGGTWTETRVPVSTINYYGDNTFTWNTTTTVTRVEGGTTTTTTETTGPGQPGEQPDIETCGLPNTPPCKIDERGTPEPTTAPTIMSPATQQLDQAHEDRKKLVEDQGGDARRTSLPWTWAFPSLAGSCTNASTSFKGNAFSVDICGSQYTGWFRALLAWALAIATAIYCWHRASSLGN